MTHPHQPAAPDEREAFEAHMSEIGFPDADMERSHHGHYREAEVNTAWKAWQARASLAAGGGEAVGVQLNATRLAIAEEMAAQYAAQLDAVREQKDGAYLERNRCVALIARMAVAMGIPVALTKTAIEGWSEDWHGCIYIGLPTGQVSWHFHDSQAHLFAGLPHRAESWDGHDTPEKYRRVAEAFTHPHQPAQERETAKTPSEFDQWWDADRLTQTNPFREDSPAFWAWEGWQAHAALAAVPAAQSTRSADVSKNSAGIDTSAALAAGGGMSGGQLPPFVGVAKMPCEWRHNGVTGGFCERCKTSHPYEGDGNERCSGYIEKLQPIPRKSLEFILHKHTKLNPNIADDQFLIERIINAMRQLERLHGIQEQE